GWGTSGDRLRCCPIAAGILADIYVVARQVRGGRRGIPDKDRAWARGLAWRLGIYRGREGRFEIVNGVDRGDLVAVCEVKLEAGLRSAEDESQRLLQGWGAARATTSI